MSDRTRIALGLAGGYLLARSRKTRWLAAAAALVAAKRLGGAAIRQGATALGSAPELEQLAEQGREAAVAVLSNRIAGLSQRIHARTESIQHALQPPSEQAGEQAGEQADQPEQPGQQQSEQAEQAEHDGGQPDGAGPDRAEQEQKQKQEQKQEQRNPEQEQEEQPEQAEQSEQHSRRSAGPDSGNGQQPDQPQGRPSQPAGRNQRPAVGGRPAASRERR
jgi:hypothetical protein